MANRAPRQEVPARVAGADLQRYRGVRPVLSALPALRVGGQSQVPGGGEKGLACLPQRAGGDARHARLSIVAEPCHNLAAPLTAGLTYRWDGAHNACVQPANRNRHLSDGDTE